MAKSLVIVESPSKAKTIKKYLGDGFQVEASVGHVKDLPKNELGVAVDDHFKPKYVAIRGKGNIIKKIRDAAKAADVVYLAPDPDREGEAIAWHIAEEIGKQNANVLRVTFNEITKKAVHYAIENPRQLDRRLFESQQARRILDRLVGYEISPLLWDKVRRGLSAGRVQSVAVRLVVEREREIVAFKSEEYWTLTALLAAALPPPFESRLLRIDGQKAQIGDGETANAVLRDLEPAGFRVASVQKKERKRSPSPPFITSRLQQEASRLFRFTAKKTMMVAQQLYEGVELGAEGQVALISYMRTDSTRLSDDSITAARDFIATSYGPQYLPPEPVHYKSKKGAQDAHEAIRPTSVDYPPEKVRTSLNDDQFRLYSLIWKRYLACQMTSALFDSTTVDVEAKGGERTYLFRTTGSVMKFDGFMALYREAKDEDATEEEDENRTLPPLAEGDELKLAEPLGAVQHFTQPPPRYSEASLIRDLEDKGIGRPSTYAAIISTILDKEYVERDKGRFRPTELGTIVTDLLVENFPRILNAQFTAQMEDELDSIEDGEADWEAMLRTFYDSFKDTLERAKQEMRNVKREEIPTDVDCEKCGAKMVIKFGKNGSFLGCSTYPECKNTKEYQRADNGDVVVKEPEVSEMACEKCARPMIVKSGKFGRFLACSGYPECRHTAPIPVGVDCPREGCEGYLTEKVSKKGKTFYSCSNFPKCDYATWNRPLAEACPQCNFPFLGEKRFRGRHEIVCPNEECGYTRKAS
jgi:DNA topoisomerase-1